MKGIKSIFLFLSFTLSGVIAFCQEEGEQRSRANYYNSFQSGGLFGKKDKGASFTFSTTHGIQLRSVRLGLGIGYDSYQRWRVLPLFGQVCWDFAPIRDNVIFLSGTGGHAWGSFRQQNEFEPDYHGARGWLINPSLGYRIRADKWDITMSAGYRWQRLNYNHLAFWWGGSEVFVKETIERVVLQIGFGIH